MAIGDGRDFVTVMLNIDLVAVGTWAERNNVVYGSYQELAGHPRVYDMLEKHVDEVNRSLVDGEAMAGAQIKRFLILHKELDADDGELTRTMKVRRGLIAERYGALVTRALRRLEEGRHRDRSDLRGRPQGHDLGARRDPRHEDLSGAAKRWRKRREVRAFTSPGERSRSRCGSSRLCSDESGLRASFHGARPGTRSAHEGADRQRDRAGK